MKSSEAYMDALWELSRERGFGYIPEQDIQARMAERAARRRTIPPVRPLPPPVRPAVAPVRPLPPPVMP